MQAETTVVQSELFTESTAKALIDQIRWAMGYAAEMNLEQLYQGLMNDVAKRG